MGGEAQRKRRRQQMVQTFSWSRFNKPIDINGDKSDVAVGGYGRKKYLRPFIIKLLRVTR